MDEMSQSDIFPGYDNVDEYCKAACQASFSCAKASKVIDIDLYDYYNTFKDFRAAINKEKDVALSLITNLIPGQKLQENFGRLDEDEQMDLLKDVNASILENVSYLLDETDGEKKPDIELVVTRKERLSINTSWNKKFSAKSNKQNTSFSLLSAKNISRPQFAFKDKIDNSSAIFVPLIKEKPNSIRPLAIFLEKDEDGVDEYCHPYECELEKFAPSPEQLEITRCIHPKPMEQTVLTYVDTPGALKSMCEELRSQKEFAVDVEHHSYRTFQGFSCLIQISTREKDYIIDSIALRSELYILNEVFTDPKIVKVLHGADLDIIWLQMNYGLYIVNMFDTGQAARVLSFAHLSLAHLLKHYCNVQPDKQYQLADWRIRPLPQELINYARSDTHYLLYIYDCMKNELIQKGNVMKNLLVSVFSRSKDICFKKYKKLVFNEEKYLDVYRKSRKIFNPRQLYCLKELYRWRDGIARLEDESYGYVLPNHMLLKICEVLPREHQGIIACCNPVPPLVQQQLNDLYAIVSKANNSSLTQLDSSQDVSKASEMYHALDLNSILHCPHDIHSYDDNRMHLKQGSGDIKIQQDGKGLSVAIKTSPIMNFNRGCNIQEEDTDAKESAQKVREKIEKSEKTLYERYVLTLQFRSKSEEDDEKLANEKEIEMKKFITIQANEATSATPNHPKSVSNIASPIAAVTDVATSASGVDVIDTDDDDVVIIETKSKKRDKKKDKKKKKRSYSDFADGDNVASSSSGHHHQPKKSKTPDMSTDSHHGTFRPFDYGNTSYNSERSKSGTPKNQRQSFKQNDSFQQNLGPRGARRKNRHGKQSSFNANTNKTHSTGRSWPST